MVCGFGHGCEIFFTLVLVIFPPLSLRTSCPLDGAQIVSGGIVMVIELAQFLMRFEAWEPAMDDELRLRFNMMKMWILDVALAKCFLTFHFEF